MELPYSKNTTLAGVVQEALQKLPAEGDSGRWGPFEFRVIEAANRANLLVELSLADEPDGERIG
jgi:CBS domain containing-hemolysin-like protein